MAHNIAYVLLRTLYLKFMVEFASSPQGKHCLLMGTIQALQSLKSIAPPITILVKAMTEESIT